MFGFKVSTSRNEEPLLHPLLLVVLSGNKHLTLISILYSYKHFPTKLLFLARNLAQEAIFTILANKFEVF